jgi:acetate kinase
LSAGSILALNAGSSSLKYALFPAAADGDGDRDGDGALGPIRSGTIDLERESLDFAAAAARAIEDAGRDTAPAGAIVGVGHRVVHGGAKLVAPAELVPDVEAEIERLSELAPLHNPNALAVARAARQAIPGARHVAVFDTAFFAKLPEAARVYPVPWAWSRDWGIRRFGFHGLSHEHAAAVAARWRGDSSETGLRVVSCHLGQGCSAAAVSGGKPVATTMGFTPLEGLMMGSRSGSVDPGVLTHVLGKTGWSTAELEDALEHRSGLLGVSGVSSDFRQVEAAAVGGNSRANLALEIYADRVRGAIGSLAASLGGLDTLVFTGGVGENSASLRAAVCFNLGFLGVDLDPFRNGSPGEDDRDVSKPGARVRVLVVRAREEAAIARKTRAFLSTARPSENG